MIRFSQRSWFLWVSWSFFLIRGLPLFLGIRHHPVSGGRTREWAIATAGTVATLETPSIGRRAGSRTKKSTRASIGENFSGSYSNYCDCFAYAQVPETVAIRIKPRRRQIAHVRVLIERLGVGQISVGHRHRRSRPIRRDEPPQATGV